MESDIIILNNIEKIEKYNNFLNTRLDNKAKYYKKLNKYSKLLSNTGIINYGGNISQQSIQEIIGPIKSMIKHQLSFKSIVLDNCNGGLKLIKYNHDEILKLLKELELIILRLLNQRKNILDKKKQCDDRIFILEKKIKELESKQHPNIILILKEKEKLIKENKILKKQLIIKEKEIIKLIERIKQIPDDKCDDRIKELIRQIMAFIDYKIRVEDVDTDVSKFTRPIFKLLDDIDTALDIRQINYEELKEKFKYIQEI